MPAPSAPTGFVATTTPYGILLQWDAQAGLDGFFVYRGVLVGHGDAALYPTTGYAAAGGGTSFMDTGVTAGTHYYYQLQASSLADGESTRVNADATALTGMTLTRARVLVQQFTRNAGSTREYSPTDIDSAIQTVCNRFLRSTKLITAAVTANIASGDTQLAFVVTQPFSKEQIIDVHLFKAGAPDGRLEVCGWQEVQERLRCNPTGTGRPCIGGNRDSAANLTVFPVNDADRTATLRYWQLLNTWTAGTGSPGSVSFNIPDQYLMEILPDGPPALLMRNVKEYAALAAAAQARYDATELRMMGSGNLGEKIIVRDSLRTRHHWD